MISPVIPEKTDNRREIVSLYFMRFICAVMIVVHHSAYFLGFNVSERIPYALDTAVDFFFVLSGMMMYYIYPNLQSKSSFLMQRFGKLMPLHWLTAGVVLLFFEQPNLKIILSNLLCIQSFIPYSEYYFSLNAVSWCVCAELFFYVCYAMGSKHIVRSLLICMMINLILFLSFAKYETLFGALGIEKDAWLKFLPLARVFEFFAGCCLAGFIKRQSPLKSVLRSNCLVVIGMGLILFSGYLIPFCNYGYVNRFITQYYRTILICGGIFLCCYPCTFLPAKTTAFLGKISFSIYITHLVIYQFFRKYEWLGPSPTILKYFVYWFSVLFISCFCFKCVEESSYRWIKKNIPLVKNAFYSIKKSLKPGIILGCFLLSCLTTIAFYPNQKNSYVTLLFNVNYTKGETSPYIKIYYIPEKSSDFSEKYTKLIMEPQLSQGLVNVPIQADKLRGLRLSFLHFKEITISDLATMGKELSPVNLGNIRSVKANVDQTGNALQIQQSDTHSYVVFNEFKTIMGKKEMNPMMIMWIFFLTLGYLILFQAGCGLFEFLKQKKNRDTQQT